MWLFNPGSPNRGSVLSAEIDRQPDQYQTQVALPPCFELFVPADSLMGQRFPSSVGQHYLNRVLPNGRLIHEGDEDPGTFEYRQVAAPVPVYEVFIGPAHPWQTGNPDTDAFLYRHTLRYRFTIDTETIETDSLTEAQVLDRLAAHGLVPINVQRFDRGGGIDYAWGTGLALGAEQPGPVWQIMRFQLGSPVLVGSALIDHVSYFYDVNAVIVLGWMPDTNPIAPADTIFRENERAVAAGSLAYWFLDWLGHVTAPRARPVLYYAAWAQFDHSAGLAFDVRDSHVFSGNEIVSDGNGFSFGDALGELTLSPAWP